MSFNRNIKKLISVSYDTTISHNNFFYINQFNSTNHSINQSKWTIFSIL